MNNKHILWCEKYRPQQISEYIFHDKSHTQPIKRMIADKTIPHLLLSGSSGTGKTSLALALAAELDVQPVDMMFINASDENSVDLMRDKLKSFTSTFALGDFKLVILDEADYISQPGQAILRNMLETNTDNVRFILTCNYENKIIVPLKSRLQHFRFKAPNVDDVTELVATILIKENVEFDLTDLDKYVTVGYPDVRKITNLIQQNSVNGTLLSTTDMSSDSSDYKFDLLDMITKDNWTAARKIVCDNVVGEEWYDIYNFLFESLCKSKKFSSTKQWEQGMVILAEHAYKHEFVAAPEINATAMFINLSMVE